ncbi:MAG: hypothetical protein JWM99_175 [Verrucomicrobiales bacterium]|nr:hypothetical protein [Verrucomicrobiales bacterium]
MTPRIARLGILLQLAAICGALCGKAETDVPWYQRSLVGMEVGPTGAHFGYSNTNDARYASQFDGGEIVRKALGAHSEYLVFWARDGDYAYYDSRLLPKAPGLRGRDPLHDAVKEAHKRYVPILAYCVVQQAGNYLKAHPEWEMHGADGKPIGRFCLNSGYLKAMKEIVAEQLAYGIDGFHIDMLDQGFGPPYGCWCRTCKALFKKQFGRSMPKKIKWDEDWRRLLQFRYETSEQFEQELYRYIKELNPRASVAFNYHGNPPFSWEVGQLPVRHGNTADFLTGETGMWGFSALTVGLNAEFYRAAAPKQRVQVAISRDARMYHNQTMRPLEDLRWELFTLLAHGAFVTVVDKTTFDGRLDPLAYERIGEAFADALKQREEFGQQPVAEVGIYFSSRTRDWFGREKSEVYFQTFLGAHKALVYDHIPWGIILDENVSLSKLKQFPIVMLPGVAILSEREIALLRRYVTEGGKLIVTGLTGSCDMWGKDQNKSSIESLIGARLIRKLDTMDNWMNFPDGKEAGQAQKFAPNGRFESPFLVKGPALIYEATSATPVGELLKPYRMKKDNWGTSRSKSRKLPEWPMSADSVVGPAVLVNQVGKGTVVTFAGSPDAATASEHHIPEDRKLIGNAIRFLNPKPRIEITAPATVETVVTDDPVQRTLRVHFIAYNSPPQTMAAKDRPFVLPAPIEDKPFYHAAVKLREPAITVKAFDESAKIQITPGQVEIIGEDIHEVVSIRY